MDDLVTYLITFGQNFPGIQIAFFKVCAVIGLFTVGISLVNHRATGQRGGGFAKGTLAGILIGSMMFSLPSVMNVVSYSFLGASADVQIIDKFTTTSGDNIRKATQVLIAFITVVGWIAAARGLWIWRIGPKHDQPGWFGSGAVHLIAGAACVNLYVVADIIGKSVGATELGTNYFQF